MADTTNAIYCITFCNVLQRRLKDAVSNIATKVLYCSFNVVFSHIHTTSTVILYQV